MSPRPRPAAAVAPVLLAIALSACTPAAAPSPSSTPTPTPTASAAPTATSTAAPVGARPAGRFDITCDDVGVVLAGLVRNPLPAPTELPLIETGPSWLPGPARYAVQQLGGIVCVFGDGVTAPTATATIVPDAAAAAAAQEATIGTTTPSASCSIDGGRGGVCSGTALQGDTFVQLSVIGTIGADGAEAGAAFADTRDALVVQAGQPRAAAAPVGIVATCEQLLPLDTAAAILGEGPYLSSAPSGGWGVQAWAISDALGATPCYLDPAGGTGLSAILTWLPGGAWSFDPAEPLQTVSVDGAEEAVITCTTGDVAPGAGCAIDIRTTADRFRVAVGGVAFDDATVDLLTEVASTVVANAASITG